MDLGELQAVARVNWTFTERDYPVLARTVKEDRLLFALRHAILHQQKAAGNLAAIAEAMDHGGPLNRELLVATLRKQLVNTMECASVAGIPALELEADILKWAAEKHSG